MNARILVFVATTYTLSIALGLVVGLTGGHESRFIGLGYLTMFFPAIAVLALRFAMNERLRIRWNSFPLRYAPLALFLIPAVMHSVMLSVTIAFERGLPWQAWLTPQADGLYHTPDQRGWGILTACGLTARIAINAVVGLIIVSMLAFFEEVGWRGWLLPRLADRIGIRPAIIVVATIWGLWHIPFALSGISYIEAIPSAVVAVIAPLGTIGVGLVLGWLWVRTESIWIVALTHGSLNNWGQYAFKYMQFTRAPDALVAAAGSLALLVLGALLVTQGLASEAPDKRLPSAPGR